MLIPTPREPSRMHDSSVEVFGVSPIGRMSFYECTTCVGQPQIEGRQRLVVHVITA